MVVIEIGAGTYVPSVRIQCEGLAVDHETTLIRINLREFDAPTGNVSLPLGGLAALQRIDAILDDMQ